MSGKSFVKSVEKSTVSGRRPLLAGIGIDYPPSQLEKNIQNVRVPEEFELVGLYVTAESRHSHRGLVNVKIASKSSYAVVVRDIIDSPVQAEWYSALGADVLTIPCTLFARKFAAVPLSKMVETVRRYGMESVIAVNEINEIECALDCSPDLILLSETFKGDIESIGTKGILGIFIRTIWTDDIGRALKDVEAKGKGGVTDMYCVPVKFLTEGN